MRDRRRLGLKREILVQLSNDDMSAVVGGSHDCPTSNCETLTHGPSLDEPCPTPTLPVLLCVPTREGASCNMC